MIDSMTEGPIMLQLLRNLGAELTANFSSSMAIPAQAEDQLKLFVPRLLEEAGSALGFAINTRTEALTKLGVRPDIGVSDAMLLIGHVELKAPGKGARPNSFTDEHDRKQFAKFKDHPNLVYTDGNEWALYREGSLVGTVVSAPGDVRANGAASYSAKEAILLEELLRDFFGWNPIVPKTPRDLASLLAPLTRLLRENVSTALADSTSALSALANEWRDVFFPDATDAQFADAYAQTVTYALLLARVEGEADLPAHAANRLDARHGLLAQVLRVLEQKAARDEVESAVGLLERAITAVQPEILVKSAKNNDIWLYFYEDFLAAYDPKLRKQTGVYYTPAEVVRAQVTLVAELLRDRFGKALGFASDDVTVLDPGVGTGTYLLAALQHGLDAVVDEYGPGQRGPRATAMARNFHGFERLIGPYAVAHLRLAREIIGGGGQLPADGVQVYLTDTLESPYKAPPGFAHAPLFEKKLAAENARARKVKAELPVLVCIGNPPYFRETVEPDDESDERQGRWIKRGDEDKPGKGILQTFIAGTPGVHTKNLYNLYVYFWRWALWKVFENPKSAGRGVVSFITASSYLRGPGFSGMRQHLREIFDELWIIDLGGEGRGARKSENVFAIQTPVAIAVGVRHGPGDTETPATVGYARIEGSRSAKLGKLAAIGGFDSIAWQDCYSGWDEPLLPESDADFFSWPALTDLFPWQHSGVQFKRTWPIAPERETPLRRWQALATAAADARPALFRETRDRKVPKDLDTPAPVPYAYRFFDRQFCLGDTRAGDFIRPVLWASQSSRQLFMTSLLSGLLGDGPAAVVTHLIPDMDHYRGSFGAKHVVPLWRDSEAPSRGTIGDDCAFRGGTHSRGSVYVLLCGACCTELRWAVRRRARDSGPADSAHPRSRALPPWYRARPEVDLAAHVRGALRSCERAGWKDPAKHCEGGEAGAADHRRIPGAARVRRGDADAPCRRGHVRARL